MDNELAVENANHAHYKSVGLKNRPPLTTMRWNRRLHDEVAVPLYDDAVGNSYSDQLHQQYTQQMQAFVSNGSPRVVLPTALFRAPQNAIAVHAIDSQYQPAYDQVIKNVFAQPQAYGLVAMNQTYQPQAHGVPRVWNGELSPRTYNNPLFSCKIFVGGIPWDITEEALREEFGRYGTCHVEWPSRDPHPLLHSTKGPSQRARAAGYVYIVFEHEASVKKLMQECSKELGSAGECYFRIRRSRGENVEKRQVQVIPWVVSDAVYTQSCPSSMESKMTVFVGALHGMLTAKVLFSIMADVYGNVISVEIDTDKYKYPIGEC
uniref:RRM domain-containing protein n=1 Tax=Parascaris univalens TaxID=6257 RepID=A0A915A4W5_PARUN